jgi:hypothetical protein
VAALDRPLPPTGTPACDACRHACASADGELYCVRGGSGAAYPCDVERGSTGVEAWVYGACGRYARFFERKPAVLPHEPREPGGRGVMRRKENRSV